MGFRDMLDTSCFYGQTVRPSLLLEIVRPSQLLHTPCHPDDDSSRDALGYCCGSWSPFYYYIPTLKLILLQLLATIFRCIPVPGNWDEAEDDTCRVDIFGLYYGSSASHVFTDIAILALPINPIRKLHMSRTLKQILYGIFALGGLYVPFSHCVFIALL